MPRSGNGTCSVPNTLVEGTPITAAPHNQNYSDLAGELTNSLALDGQSAMSGQFKAASGSVGVPGISFGSDTDSGVWRKGGNNLGVGVGGAEVLDISTSGLGVTGALSASGALSAASLAITADLPISDGGTGQSTATAAFDALAPTTTRGDIIVRGASNNGRLAIGAADTLLKSDGTDAAYGKLVNANITDTTIAHAKLASGVTATQAIMEAASATDSFVPPGRQHFHPLMPKAWGMFDGTNTGTFSPSAGHGVASITRTSTGTYTVALSTSMSSASYAVMATACQSATGSTGGHLAIASATSLAAGSFRLLTGDNNTDNLVDYPLVSFMVLGDL